MPGKRHGITAEVRLSALQIVETNLTSIWSALKNPYYRAMALCLSIFHLNKVLHIQRARQKSMMDIFTEVSDSQLNTATEISFFKITAE